MIDIEEFDANLLHDLRQVVAQHTGDKESEHAEADKTIVIYFRELGLAKSADFYEEHIGRWWYA